MNQNERKMQALQERVRDITPMFTLTASQRRLGRQLHWRLARHKVTWAMTSLRPTKAEMAAAGWADHQWGRDIGPTPAALRQMEAQFKELAPKAADIFQQVTAPRMMLDAINRGANRTPQSTLTIQMQEVLNQFRDRVRPLLNEWRKPFHMTDTVTFPTGENLQFLSGVGQPFGWTGTAWGMFEHLEAVVAQMSRWERMCQAITREMDARAGAPGLTG